MQKYLLEDWKALQQTLNNSNHGLCGSFSKALSVMVESLKNGRKILIFGNGGSAADAEHFAGEIVGRFAYDRNPLPCIALTVPSAVFSAISNDYGYYEVFQRQIAAFGKPGDTAIGITTSGNSPNVVYALETAAKMGIHTIGITGENDSKVSGIAQITLRAPSKHTPRIQEIHALLVHAFCRGIEQEIFPRADFLSLPDEKIIDENRIASFSEVAKAYKSVFTNGCFDILHPGHVTLLRKARDMGDFLILGLNTDESVRKLKGEGRPYHCLEDRMSVLAALECVDYIIPFSEETPEKLITTITPKVLVKGGDYNINTIVGADWVLKYGGSVEVIPLKEGHSTTRILKCEK
ncbi:MAG: D-glycero-beta-D-manno-heptose 1-phosphate adenylyltransferase [Candidatus Riflebacteria bacterium]|nr:D-glycero-beta-D-manno-heptose 1-phosphate adenylyltransferase [Candidatus Riflebacteria bacterium]